MDDPTGAARAFVQGTEPAVATQGMPEARRTGANAVSRAGFDRFADEYDAMHRRSIAVSGESPEYFAEYKIVDLKRIVAREPGGDRATGRFLDVGAGIGRSIAPFHKHFPRAHLTCLDVSTRSLRRGRERSGGNDSFVAFDGQRLPFADASFDCGFANCVFHHVDTIDQVTLLRELHRVLKPDAHLLVYEHNPRNPLTVRAVAACEFDRDATLIDARALAELIDAAGFSRVATEYRVFFPRALGWLRRFEPALAALPLGAQYFVSGRR